MSLQVSWQGLIRQSIVKLSFIVFVLSIFSSLLYVISVLLSYSAYDGDFRRWYVNSLNDLILFAMEVMALASL